MDTTPTAMTIASSAISGNSAGNQGGGIYRTTTANTSLPG